MNRIRASIVTLPLLVAGVAHADQGPVVASIKPVHSLVSAVMGEVGQPELIVQGASSPHLYSLSPSQARALSDAAVVVWVGEGIESFLVDTLGTLSSDATVIELAELPGLVLHDFREGGPFEAHDDDHGHDEHAHAEDDHDDHDHDEHAHGEEGHDEHDHDEHAEGEGDHDEHGHDEHAHDDDDHDEHGHDDADHDEVAEGHDDHGHHHASDHDMHIWLDPTNAVAIVRALEQGLSDADPANATAYSANANATVERLEALQVSIDAKLESVRDVPFIVFHDAYQYFEHRFGLTAAGSITVSPEVLPGAKRLDEIKHKVEDERAACVFSEPQFSPKLVDVVVEGTNSRTGVLDPLGVDIEAGPDHYFELIEVMAETFSDCLSASS